MLKKLQTYFITGLVVLLPTVVSIYVFLLLFNFIDKLILGKLPFAEYIPGLNYLNSLAQKIPGIGFISTILLILLIGILAKNIIGKRLINFFDRLMLSLPVVKSIYNAVKQIIEAFIRQDKDAFQKVVLLEYPRKGLYALAFVTGTTRGEIQAKTRQEMINVFLPTTPNPTSGFLLLVPREDLIPLEMSVEEGIKLIISGGVVTPPYQVEEQGGD
ncbi:MAG: hypothetical protein PWQ67_230 [Clostridia bacterium]|jgi:uncharacterized membrane protein|nr:hypothetical protein [Clostridia bacterium]MDN5321776.1 hypothetical protein [Clostridia bacterium]